MTTITREFAFDMGHMLPDHEGACHRPHGHRYRGEVTVEGEIVEAGAERGMVTDFGQLKGAIERQVIEVYDHRFAVCVDDPRLAAMQEIGGDGVLTVFNPPTAENLARWIGGSLQDALSHVRVVSVRLWETPNCSATWTP